MKVPLARFGMYLLLDLNMILYTFFIVIVYFPMIRNITVLFQ